MADRNVTVRLSAEVAGFTQEMGQAERSASQVADSADRAAQSTERMGQANQTAAAGVSASSEALFRLSGGLSGAESEATKTTEGMRAAAEQARGFDSAMSQAGTSIGEGISLSQGFSGALLGVGQGFVQAGEASSSFFTTAQGLSSEFTQMGGAMAVVGGGMAALAGSVLSTGVQYNTLQQVAGRAMETMTGSTEAAADQMERLHSFADTSPFARDTWIQAQQQLMAFGLEAERVVPTLEGVQNAVAAIGGGDQEIMQLVDILGTVEGQGRMTGRELQRLGQMGINAAELIGESMGVSGNEIREQITAGALDAETAITALTDGMNTRFDGAAEGLRDTMTGAIDRIMARMRDLGSVMAEPLVSADGGGFLVEAINQAADFGSTLLDLPEPLLQVAGLGTAAVGGILLLSGAFFMAAPRVVGFYNSARDTVGAIRDFNRAHPGMASGLKGVGAAAGIAAAAFAAFQGVQWLNENMREGGVEAAEMSLRLSNLAESGGNATEALHDLGSTTTQTVSGIGSGVEDYSNLADSMDILDAATWTLSGTQRDAVDSWRAVESALVSMVQGGDIQQATSQFAELSEAALEQGYSLDEIADRFPEYTAAVMDWAAAQGVAISPTEATALAIAGIEPSAIAAAGGLEAYVNELNNIEPDEASEGITRLSDALLMQAEYVKEAESALNDLTNAYFGANSAGNDLSEAIMAHAENMREFDEVLDENGNTMNRWTEAGAENYQAVIDLAGGSLEVAEAMIAAGESAENVTGHLMGTYQGFYDLGESMNMSASEAADFAGELMGIPEEHRTDVEAHFEDYATEGVQAMVLALDSVPEFTEVTVIMAETGMLGQIEITKEQLESIRDRTVDVTVSDNGSVMEVQGGIDNVKGKTEFVYVQDDGTARVVQSRINNVTGKTEYVYVDDNGTVQVVQGQIDGVRDGSANINAVAQTALAEQQLARVARARTANIDVRVAYTNASGSGGRGSIPGYASGGRAARAAHAGMGLAGLPGFSTGGRMPQTGLGTDQILGVNQTGMPIARVDDLEWIVNRHSSDKYNRLLGAINRDDPRIQHLAGFAGGGRPGYQGQVREFAGSGGVAPRITAGDIARALGGGAGRTVQFNITNHNPQAEPTSMSIKRGSEYMGAGVFE